MFLLISGGHIGAPKRYTNRASPYKALQMCVKRFGQGGLATAFDLAAFRLSMIAPVKKSVNHSRTVASMRVTG